MEKVRDNWTDERLDDLKGEVVELGRRVDLGFAEGRSELRHEVASLRTEMSNGFKSLDSRFDAMQRTMIQFGGLVIAALIGLIATQL